MNSKYFVVFDDATYVADRESYCESLTDTGLWKMAIPASAQKIADIQYLVADKELISYLKDSERDILTTCGASRSSCDKEWWDIHFMFHSPGSRCKIPNYEFKDVYSAVRDGDLEWFKKMPARHCDPNWIALAAGCGQLEIMKVVFQKTRMWGFNTTVLAAYNDQPECLQWALETGCPLHLWTTRAAEAGGSEECKKISVGWGCPFF
jgi:hypothetical protein